MTVLDKRLHAYRDDLADARLEGQVIATRFSAGRLARVTGAFADVKSAPSADAGLSTQALHGADVRVFDQRDGWAWVQLETDSYVGYVRSETLVEPGAEPTHVAAAPRTFLYPRPDMKAPRASYRSMGSLVVVTDYAETRGTRYALLDSGEAMIAAHLKPVADHVADYVAVAETLEHAPYLWGGSTGFGLDCSGLVQLAMRMAGRPAPRDSDMQAAGLGTPIDPGLGHVNLKRGDLVFWKGHVAIVTGPDGIIHANGHTMSVARESLSGAIERIGYLYGQPTGYRRP
jgi:cell wall-associated NlpC family hydrolase